MSVHKPPKQIEKIMPVQVTRFKRLEHGLDSYFAPNDGRLRFYKVDKWPAWLQLSEHGGQMVGVAPNIKNPRKFKLKFRVHNPWGDIESYLYVVVVPADFIATLTHALLKPVMPFRRGHLGGNDMMRIPDLLEYLYEFLMQDEFTRQETIKKIKADAKKLGITLGSDFTYRDFEEVVKAMNPNIEKDMRARRDPGDLLLKEEVRNAEFRNLVRQGSQQQGTIQIPVYNHMGAPNFYVWSEINNILDSASKALTDLREDNEFKQEKSGPGPKM